MNKRVLGIVAKWLFILALPILLLTASIAATANSQWLYTGGYEKYGVSQTTGLDKAELEKVAKGLISYFNSGEEYIDLTVVKNGEPFELFNGREIIHLKDVKGLIQLDYRIAMGTFIYCLAYALICLFWQRKKHWRRLAYGLVVASGITLGLMVALAIGAVTDFGGLWLQFHFLSFANQLWMLDPMRDYLIMLFPEGLFFDMALFLGSLIVGVAVILGVVGGVYLRRNRKQIKLAKAS